MEKNSDKVCIKRHTKKELEDVKITLLNWNVHKNNHHYKWLHDFDEILKQYKPNIISFQEYQTMGRRSIIDKQPHYAYGFFPNIAFKQHMYGLLTAAKADIDDFTPLFTSDVEPLIKTPKVSFVTSHRMFGGEILSVVNVHMINFVKIRKYIAQVKQIESACRQKEGALILTGDFNTWSRKRMRILLSMTREVGLKLALFEKEDHKKPFLSYPLDHIFYRGLKQDKSLILNKIESSDHKPMLVTFSPLS
jgi:endonuclease/exonuclease/phosphatase (EEP) superfamily protein YafD